jgi:hypothetical protein
MVGHLRPSDAMWPRGCQQWPKHASCLELKQETEKSTKVKNVAKGCKAEEKKKNDAEVRIALLRTRGIPGVDRQGTKGVDRRNGIVAQIEHLESTQMSQVAHT